MTARQSCPVLGPMLLAVCLCAAPAHGAAKATTRVGAKVVKQALGMAAPPPTVLVLDNPDRWTVMAGEKWTGENAHEFYFTLEAQGNAPPPRVEVRLPGTQVARVLGAVGKVEMFDGGARFATRPGRAPTGVRTSLKVGRNVHLCIFHNWEVRRAGPYRQGPYPHKAIQAQLNYLFAAREAAKAMGLATAADPGFVGDVRLYGFETNFPNGHVDHPPHFHIMLGWPGWLGTQVTHFRQDAEGVITHNHFQTDDGKKVTSRTYARGETCRLYDREGKLGFELTVEPDGKGVVWRWPAAKADYLLRANTRTASPADGVEVCRRPSSDAPWYTLCWVHASDAADRGEMRIVVRPTHGDERVETIRYDPDTGSLRK